MDSLLNALTLNADVGIQSKPSRVRPKLRIRRKEGFQTSTVQITPSSTPLPITTITGSRTFTDLVPNIDPNGVSIPIAARTTQTAPFTQYLSLIHI
jgi:hypothetical protein